MCISFHGSRLKILRLLSSVFLKEKENYQGNPFFVFSFPLNFPSRWEAAENRWIPVTARLCAACDQQRVETEKKKKTQCESKETLLRQAEGNNVRKERISASRRLKMNGIVPSQQRTCEVKTQNGSSITPMTRRHSGVTFSCESRGDFFGRRTISDIRRWRSVDQSRGEQIPG